MKTPKKQPSEKRTTDNGFRITPDYGLLLSYLVLPVFLYGFDTLDANGPKFLAIAVLNCIAFLYFLSDQGFRSNTDLQTGYFKNFASIAYLAFLVFSALSLVKALNIVESLVVLSKAFTIFSAAYILWVILKRNRNFPQHLILILNLILLADSLTVFYNILLFISGDISSIMDIRSVYSHKNVLAAALFIKLPAAVYLIFFREKWQKWLGYVSAIFAMVAILGLSARAFYLGLGLLFLVLLVIALYRYKRNSEKNMLAPLMWWTGILAAALVIYSVLQFLLFPKDKDPDWNTNLVSRLSTIRLDESSTNARLTSWTWSWKMFAREPILGVGAGNWKVRVLEYENQVSPEFYYSIKAHNDFLENLVETGLLGGIAFILIFAGVTGTITRKLRRQNVLAGKNAVFLVPGLALMAYVIDAFFNFPSDRPEIQVLFALFFAWILAESDATNADVTGSQTKPGRFSGANRVLRMILPALVVVFMVLSTRILYQNAVSLYYQLISRQENFNETFRKTSDFFIRGYPAMPNLTCLGEPIVITKARYLILEERYREAIPMLKNDRSSPFDCRCDYYLSMIYDKLGLADSALYWGLTAHRKQPLYGNVVLAVSSRLFASGKTIEAKRMVNDYLSKYDRNPKAFVLSARYYWMEGDVIKASKVLHAGSHVLHLDSASASEAAVLLNLLSLYPYHDLYDQAKRAMNNGNFQDAISKYNVIIANRPGYPESYTFRALCLSQTGKYRESVKDINKAIALGLKNRSDLINLRGVNHHRLGNIEKACRDFQKAMEQGNPQAASNFRKYCGKNQ